MGRLVIISNRLPVTYKDGTWTPSAGGLATGLGSLEGCATRDRKLQISKAKKKKSKIRNLTRVAGARAQRAAVDRVAGRNV